MSAKTDCTKVVLNLVVATAVAAAAAVVVVVVGVSADKAFSHLPLLSSSYYFVASRAK